MVKIMETPIKIDDLGVPLFLETPISNIRGKAGSVCVCVFFFAGKTRRATEKSRSGDYNGRIFAAQKVVFRWFLRNKRKVVIVQG